MAASRPIQIATGNTTMSHSISDPNNKYHLNLPGTSSLQGNLAQGLQLQLGRSSCHRSGYTKKPTIYLLSFLRVAGLIMVFLAHSKVSRTVTCCSKALLNIDKTKLLSSHLHLQVQIVLKALLEFPPV
jgi:hypothetical protein